MLHTPTDRAQLSSGEHIRLLASALTYQKRKTGTMSDYIQHKKAQIHAGSDTTDPTRSILIKQLQQIGCSNS